MIKKIVNWNGKGYQDDRMIWTGKTQECLLHCLHIGRPGLTAILDITTLSIFSVIFFFIFCIILIHVTNCTDVLSSSLFFFFLKFINEKNNIIYH